tara:strand:+ start:1206 stop:1499 length:294 start_codon:yes stop_codon:yes gene_type:complete
MLKKNLTKKNLSNKLHKNLGFSKNMSSTLIDDFFESFNAELIKEKIMKFSSFGTFQVRQKKERIGRNPKTKIETKITARKVVTFKPSTFIKNKVNDL